MPGRWFHNMKVQVYWARVILYLSLVYAMLEGHCADCAPVLWNTNVPFEECWMVILQLFFTCHLMCEPCFTILSLTSQGTMMPPSMGRKTWHLATLQYQYHCWTTQSTGLADSDFKFAVNSLTLANSAYAITQAKAPASYGRSSGLTVWPVN
jgi:hypothetical protein